MPSLIFAGALELERQYSQFSTVGPRFNGNFSRQGGLAVTGAQ